MSPIPRARADAVSPAPNDIYPVPRRNFNASPLLTYCNQTVNNLLNWSFVLYERPVLNDDPNPHFVEKVEFHEIGQILCEIWWIS